MIPINEIRAWSNVVPWINDEQIEQDLVICRSLVEIFSDELLSKNLVTIGKYFFSSQPSAFYRFLRHIF